MPNVTAMPSVELKKERKNCSMIASLARIAPFRLKGASPRAVVGNSASRKDQAEYAEAGQRAGYFLLPPAEREENDVGYQCASATTELAALRTARTLAVAISSSMPTPQTVSPPGPAHST